MSTIAQQLNIKKFPFIIEDENGNIIYYENSSSHWYKQEFDSQGNEIYFENYEGFWYKREYDSEGNKIYYENSNGKIVDHKPKLTKAYQVFKGDIDKHGFQRYDLVATYFDKDKALKHCIELSKEESFQNETIAESEWLGDGKYKSWDVIGWDIITIVKFEEIEIQ